MEGEAQVASRRADYTKDLAFMKAPLEDQHSALIAEDSPYYDPAYAKASRVDQERFLSSLRSGELLLDLGTATGIRAETPRETITSKVKRAVPALELIGKTLETPAGEGLVGAATLGPAAVRAMKASPMLKRVAGAIPVAAKAAAHYIPHAAGLYGLHRIAQSLSGKK